MFDYTYGRNGKSKVKLESSFWVFTLNVPFYKNLYGHETKSINANSAWVKILFLQK